MMALFETSFEGEQADTPRSVSNAHFGMLGKWSPWAHKQTKQNNNNSNNNTLLVHGQGPWLLSLALLLSQANEQLSPLQGSGC